MTPRRRSPLSLGLSTSPPPAETARKGHDHADDFTDYWNDIHPGLKTDEPEPAFRAPPLDQLIRWTLSFSAEDLAEERPSMVVVPGPSRADRTAFFDQYLDPEWHRFRPGTIEDVSGSLTTDWMTDGIPANLARRYARASVPAENLPQLPPGFRPRGARPPPYELLWALLMVSEFVIEEPLRSIVDRSNFLVHDAFKLLWETRFRVAENKHEEARDMARAMVLWSTGKVRSANDLSLLKRMGSSEIPHTDESLLDLMCFYLALAAQNGIINRIVILFDSLELALTTKRSAAIGQLYDFILAVDRWIGIGGSPIGIVIGFSDSKENMRLLRKEHKLLADRVERGLQWAKP